MTEINNDEQWVEFRNTYIQHKRRQYDNNLFWRVSRLADYLRLHSIKNVVLGVSGGVDSALVLAMLARIKESGIIPDLNINAYCITFDSVYPCFDKSYVTELMDCFGDAAKIKILDLSESFDLYAKQSGFLGNKFLMAQSSYALRYNLLFTHAQACNGITLGTTNRDEFAFSGWFGKNSDMMVDVQPIIDMHKFEVNGLASALGVPDSIVNRVPTGDLIDGSSDEDNFGCSYDDLAVYTLIKTQNVGVVMTPFLENKFAKLEQLHKKNYHKYLGQGYNPVFL